MKDIQAVIFDWGKTLWDNNNWDKQKLMNNATEVLSYCKGKYRLALVSLTTIDSIEERTLKIKKSGLDKFFEYLDIVSENKDAAFERTVKKLGLDYNEICVVDDRTIRGIRWGNNRGCTTIWLQKGQFSSQSPTEETGKPDYTIHELKELLDII